MADFLALVADMHLVPLEVGRERALSPLDNPSRRAARFGAARKQVERLRPKAVLFGGDNMHLSLTRDDVLRYGADFMARFPGPRYCIPGNHDIGSTVGWHHHDPEEMSEACAAFRVELGPDWWVLEAAGFRVLGVNSQVFGSFLPEAEEQIDWLRAELARPSSHLRAVFLHTPPYLKKPDDAFDDGSEQMCLRPQARAPLLEILNRYPPDLVISAHCHRFWTRKEPEWDWLGLPATSLGQSELDCVPHHNVPEGDDRVGWVALKRKGSGWTAEMHAVE